MGSENMVKHHDYNRTYVELKFARAVARPWLSHYNRTYVELKYIMMIAYQKCLIYYNRTYVELK